MKRAINIPHESGWEIEIFEDELATLSAAELNELNISRDELHWVFAEGQRLMRKHRITERDRVRPCADQTPEGEWFVVLVEYSPLSDPLLQGRTIEEQKNRPN